MEVYKSGIHAGSVNMSSAPYRRGNDQFDRRQDSFGLPEGSCAGPSRPRGHSPDYVKVYCNVLMSLRLRSFQIQNVMLILIQNMIWTNI